MEVPAQSDPLVRVAARHAGRDIAVQLVGRVLNLGLGLVVTVLVVRLLGDEGFGQWATLLAISQIAAYVIDFGLESVTVRQAAADPQREAEWVGALLVLRFALALPVTVAAGLVVMSVASTETMRISGLILLGPILLLGPAALRVVFQLRVRNGLTIAVVTLNSVLWTGGAAVLAFSDGGLVTLSLIFAGAAAAASALQAVLSLRLLRPQISHFRARAERLLRAGVPVGIAGLLITAYAKIDHILVFQLAGAREAGLYGAAYRFLDQAQFVPAALMTTLFPLIAAAQRHDPARLRRLIQVAVDYLPLASLPAIAFAVVAAEPLIRLLFGAEFAAAAPALPVLMTAFLFVSIGYLAGNLVLVLGRQQRFLVYAAWGLVLNLGLNIAFIPVFGFMAAAWATLVTEVLVSGLALRLVLTDLAFRPTLGRLGRTLAASVFMALVLVLARLQNASALVLVLLAAIAFIAAGVVTGAFNLRELRALARKEVL